MCDASNPQQRVGSGIVDHRNPPVTIWERSRKSNLNKGIETKLYKTYFGCCISGFPTSPVYLFWKPESFFGSVQMLLCVVWIPEDRLIAKNSVEISAAPFHLIEQFFCMENGEMRDRLCSKKRRRRLNHTRIRSRNSNGQFLATWILQPSKAGYLLFIFLRSGARKLASWTVNSQ